MSYIHTNMKLALALALILLGPAACNNQKAGETTEEESTEETQSEHTPNRDNRNVQSGDAAFIKIFPDGEVTPGRNEPAASQTSPAASTGSDSATPTESTTENSGSAPPPSADIPADEDVASNPPSQPIPSDPAEETPAPAPAPEPPVIVDNEPVTPPAPTPEDDNAQAPAPDTTVVEEPAPAPEAEPAPAPSSRYVDDTTREILAINEKTTASIIAVLPKSNLSIVSLGKHKDFIPGPYLMLGKWTNNDSKVKIKIKNSGQKEKERGADETAVEGDWKPLGVFYLTSKATVMITNTSFSAHSVKNELLLKPVVSDKLTKPSLFHCLGGQILGHGLVDRQ
jgi:hypothetical protein